MQSQIRLQKSSLVEVNGQPVNGGLPLGIEQFLANYPESHDTTNVIKLNSKIMSKYENTGVKWATEKDAPTVVKLHEQVYKGHYPYHEMLDTKYIGAFASSLDNGVIGLYSSIEASEVGGCGIMMVDKKDRVGYMRGLMILPEYLGKIDAKKGALDTVKFGYNRYREDVDKWYTETRTAHSKAQYLMECIGCRPCAIFPNKDIFFGGKKRESDVLDVSYFNKTLYLLRNPAPILVPDLKRLYYHIANRYELPSAHFYDSYLTMDFSFLDSAYKNAEDIIFTITEGEFNTDYYKLKTKKGSYIKFMVTKTIESAEKTEIYAISPLELTSLLIKLDQVMDENNIEYFEYYLPAVNPEFQAIFLEFDFSVFGYVPAWSRNEHGTLDDCIVVGKYKTPLDFDKIQLTDLGIELFEVIREFLH